MSAIEDIRKILQDLVVPDLKALDVTVKDGLAAGEKLATMRYELMLAEIKTLRAELKTHQTVQDSRYEAIMRALDVDKRLENLERRVKPIRPATSLAASADLESRK